MKKSVPLEVKQAEMWERQWRKRPKHLRKNNGSKEVAELLKLIKRSMKEPGFWKD